MGIVEQFIARWQQLDRSAGDSRMSLPTRAATAAAECLPGVGGAAICLCDADGARLPVGVSGAPALLAEQLEYTIGDGPGLHAQRTASSVVAGHHFARRWPVFHNSLLDHTTFRAARAVPLAAAAADWFAVLLLYYRCVDDVHNLDIAAVTDYSDVVDVVSCVVMCAMTELATQMQVPPGAGLPHPVEQRLAVNVATGMLIGARHLPAADALDVLRGHAYAHNQTVDHTAVQLVSGELGTHVI